MENKYSRSTGRKFATGERSKEKTTEIARRMSEMAPKAAQKMVEASGQAPQKYSPLTRECMAALIYGVLGAISTENLGYHEWRWTGMEMALIAVALFGMDPEQGAHMSNYLFENSSKQQNPDLNENINQLIHYGIDLYYLLDQPERLEKAIQAILQACYKAFGTGEKN